MLQRALKPNHTVAVDNVPDASLDRLETYRTTRLALEMVNTRGEGLELEAAAGLKAVVQRFPVWM